MAEFTSTMHEWGRMCNAHAEDCPSCPLNGKPFCEKEIFDLTPSVIKEAEQIIMAWAKEHPEPVYPRWVDWLVQVGILGCETRQGHDTHFVEQAMFDPIPADLAQKLGLQPKDG